MPGRTLAALWAASLASAALLSGCGGSAEPVGVPAAPDPCEAIRPQIEAVAVAIGDVFISKPGAAAAASMAVAELKAAVADSPVVPPEILDNYVGSTKQFVQALAADPTKGRFGPASQRYRASAREFFQACQPQLELPGSSTAG